MTDEFTRITLEVEDHVLLIGLNRPEKRNAADLTMLRELSLAFGKLDVTPDLRVGIVFAHGEHFTSGLDLNDVAPALAANGSLPLPEGGLDPWGISSKQVRKPVVLAIQGICYTLGVELALASDVVVASENATFAQLEVTRGILPFGGGTTRMPRIAGWGNAMKILLTGEPVSASEAFRVGIVTDLVESEPLRVAKSFASKIAAQAPLAVQATLDSARSGTIDPIAEQKKLPSRLGALMMTKDVQRGLEAFVSKKPAQFEGN